MCMYRGGGGGGRGDTLRKEEAEELGGLLGRSACRRDRDFRCPEVLGSIGDHPQRVRLCFCGLLGDECVTLAAIRHP